MSQPLPPPGASPSGLGPHCVGQRVVVRRVVAGERGPTGGPALTDLLGVMESWADGSTTVRAEDGTVTTIALADIVSGKPVPPRPSVRSRVTPEEAELRAVATWPAVETVRVGAWLLRAASGYSARANSALLVGEPDRPREAALAEVARFYADHGLPARVQVVTGAEIEVALSREGWHPARPGDADVVFLLGGVAAAARAVRRASRSAAHVEVTGVLPDGWLADDPRAQLVPEAAYAVLTGPVEVGFAEVHLDGAVVARGRAALGDEPDPWVGITGLWVAPDHRRRGLGSDVMRALLGWAAERGATTAYLQVLADNGPALALYERLGFAEHHTYRYLQAP